MNGDIPAGTGVGVPAPHGTAELQVGEDLPAGDVPDEEAEVLRVPEPSGRVVQQRPCGFVQGRAQCALSLPGPSGGSVSAGPGLSTGETAAPELVCVWECQGLRLLSEAGGEIPRKRQGPWGNGAVPGTGGLREPGDRGTEGHGHWGIQDPGDRVTGLWSAAGAPAALRGAAER